MKSTTDWSPSSEHPGYHCKTIQRGDCTITILRPDLGGEEQRKREALVKTAAENALKSYIHNRKVTQ